MPRANTVLRMLMLAACLANCAGCGPHMNIQASVKPYEQKMPNLPVDTVPTNGKLDTFTTVQSKTAANPLPPTPANLQNGKIYYGYYCVQCHGAAGDGNGPVGQSYVPKPIPLTSGAISLLSDGELYSAMLVGVGHSPVLEQTVLPEHRWPLVMYVRTFSKAPTAGGAAPSPPPRGPLGRMP